ncbi:MAG: UDP-2,4-diacetamido-2,4,6-trideoxy-beta-L-altropyranose hydrolase [Dissulfurispiraceae bacterium]
MNVLLIRADAGEQMGTGHVMRTLALAQAWQDAGGGVRYAMAAPSPGIAARLNAESVEIDAIQESPGSDDDARQTVELARLQNAAWVVVDGYQFGGNYQRLIKESGLQLLVLDDYGHAEHYWADLVLNQNLHANESLYRNREPYTRLLLGVRFALLRREFLKWQGWQREIPTVASKVLVTVGGGDPDNVTLRMMEALGRIDIPGIEAVVLAGAANRHYAGLQAAANCSPAKIRLESNASDMPSLMAWADIALGAAGSTSWERAFMGLPSLVVVLAANQKPLARELAAVGVVGDLGSHDRLDVGGLADRLSSLLQSSPERRRMADAGKQMIDGEGGRRVLMRVRGDRLRLRKATAADCELLWRWANQPEVRAHSFNSEQIPWDTHVAWFEKKLRDTDCHIFIGFNRDDSPVGQVRFDACLPDTAEIDISIRDDLRGQGYGAALLQSAVTELFRTTENCSVLAMIKIDNSASVQTFRKAGFSEAESKSSARKGVICYVRRRDTNE